MADTRQSTLEAAVERALEPYRAVLTAKQLELARERMIDALGKSHQVGDLLSAIVRREAPKQGSGEKLRDDAPADPAAKAGGDKPTGGR